MLRPSQVAARPRWGAFLELGFRPLYLAGTSWAALSIALWIYAPELVAGTMAGVSWHAHEMLWGFVGTIAAGFLLTAASNWTGMNPLQGRALGGVCLLWIAARLGYLLPGTTALVAAAVCEVAFFAACALALGRSIFVAKSRRNYAVPLFVAGFAVADALYLAAVFRGDVSLVLQRFEIGLLCMAVLALLIARRVIPFFAMRAVPGLQVPMLTRAGLWQLIAASLAIVFMMLDAGPAEAGALAASGAIALVQVVAWKPWAIWRQPLLWILYVGYAALGVGLVVASAQVLDLIERAAWPTHVIATAGFSVLIIGMVTRTALGHLGRPLQADRAVVAMYVLVIAAAVLRLLALAPTAMALVALRVSAAAWVLGFALYLWRFVPMMVRPRAAAPAAPPILRPVR